MRQLITNDIFAMSRILSKMDLNVKDLMCDEEEDYGSTLSDEEKEKKASEEFEKFGLAIMKQIAEKAHLAQNDINDFIGGLAGITGDEFGNLPLKESLEIMKQFRELDGLSGFFKSAGRLMK